MLKLIEQIKGRLTTAQYQSEAAIREAIVLPILQALGWDILDPTSVLREYPLGSRRVDYALVVLSQKVTAEGI
jgi:predicted type IV restriction endonuclease